MTLSNAPFASVSFDVPSIKGVLSMQRSVSSVGYVPSGCGGIPVVKGATRQRSALTVTLSLSSSIVTVSSMTLVTLKGPVDFFNSFETEASVTASLVTGGRR